MKHPVLIQHLLSNGCEILREDGSYTVLIRRQVRKTTTVPRHREINDFLARKICRDMEVTTITREMLFASLHNDAEYLHRQWRLWWMIKKDRKQNGITTQIAASFFALIERTLVEAVILGLCRLVDKRKDVLQINRLKDSMPEEWPTEAETNLSAATQLIISQSKIQKYRHNILAHRNYETRLGQVEYPIVFAEQIDEIFLKLQNLFVAVSKILDAPTFLDVESPSKEASIIGVLERLKLTEMIAMDSKCAETIVSQVAEKQRHGRLVT